MSLEAPGGVIMEEEAILAFGMCRLSEGANRGKDKRFGRFYGVTGSSDLADPTFNQAAAIQLIADAKTQRGVPRGHRCYLDSLTLAMQGNTAWTTAGGGLIIQDSLGSVLAMFPLMALVPSVQYAFPAGALYVPQIATASSAVGLTVTFPGGTFVTTTLSGQVATIIAGTGIGQSRLIASNTATVLTFVGAWETLPDATSVFELRGQVATAGAGSTITANNTPFVVNGLKDMFVVITDGTGAGQVRGIASNTNAVITIVSAWITNPDATSVFQITSAPELLGACDYGIAAKWPKCTQANVGLQAILRGTPGAGSPVKIGYSGYFGPGV